MSGLIAKGCGSVEAYDSTCPDCGSSDVVRSSTFTLEELSSVSPWCVKCKHSWFEKVA